MSKHCARIIISMNKKNEMEKAVSSAKQSLISQGYNQELEVKPNKRSLVVSGCKG